MKIAIIDDSKNWRQKIKEEIFRYLDISDKDIDMYSGGEQYLESQKKYDISFVDIEMAGIDGFETISSARKYNPDGFYIILTTHEELSRKGYIVNALPCGSGLLEELKEVFPRVSAFNDLSKVSTVLEKSIEKEEFKNYLTNRFSVGEYDALYTNLARIKLKSIFSTNIDDLIFRIWENEKQSKYYINNTLGLGELSDDFAINYYPVHGCVLNYDKDYIFSNIKIASAYTSQDGSWESLKLTVSSSPILFWGWSFNDSDIIEAIYSSRSKMVDDNTRKWIVLYEPEEFEIEFYKSLNFSIIIASTREFLE